MLSGGYKPVIIGLGDLARVAILCVLCLASSFLFFHGRTQAGIDFHQFWAIAGAAGIDTINVYDPNSREDLALSFQNQALDPRERAAANFRQAIEPTATPLLYTAFLPLTLLGYDQAHLAYCIIMLVCAIAGVMILALQFGYNWSAALAITAAIVLFYRPLLSEISVANVNAIQLALLSVVILLESRSSATIRCVNGGLITLLVLFKPNLAAVAILLWFCYLIRRDWSGLFAHALGAVGGAVLGLLCSITWFGSVQAWFNWLGTMGQMVGWFDMRLLAGNYSLARLFLEITGFDLWWLISAVGFIVIFHAIVRKAGKCSEADFTLIRYLAIGAGCALPLIASPLAWLHYYLLLLPALLCLVFPRFIKVWPSLIILIVMLAPEILGYAGVELSGLAIALIFIISALAVFVLIVLRLHWIQDAPRPDAGSTPSRSTP